MKKRVECDIYGRVQGVFFRGFCAGLAKDMNIVGYVQNMEDGSVQLVAEGKKDLVEDFLKKIRKGNKYSRVEKIKTSWGDASGDFDNFNII